jgi:hypothetical protein
VKKGSPRKNMIKLTPGDKSMAKTGFSAKESIGDTSSALK